ncbi:MAG: VCBS repeat-containing protein [Thermoplasmatales archaeon]|nr:MAG: VCBS repeat-containing protein [Thermoplasmatales archaeon]
MNNKPNILYKILVIGIVILFIGTNAIPSTGNKINILEKQTNELPKYMDLLSLHGFDNGFFITKNQHDLNLLSPVIDFPLTREVFRVGDIIEINGTASMPGFQYYIIEWGIGKNPTEWFTEGVTLINNGTVEIINGTLGFWDTSSVTDANFYNIKLTVPVEVFEQNEATVSIYLDPTLHVNFPFGWPHEIQGTQVTIWSPIALSDINDDGYQEIGFGTISVESPGDNNNDYVIDHMGNILQGWPKNLYAIQGASLTFADIDTSTSNKEVIGGMWGEEVYVWYDNGTLVDGWPTNIYASRATPSVNDIDCDGDLEIIIPTTDGGGIIYVFHHDGTIADGWPVLIGSPVRRGVSTADIDKDGFPELLFGDQDGFVYALHHDGSYVDGWPQLATDIIKSSPVIADIEGDGDLEVIMCSGFAQPRIISIWHHDGTMVDGWPQENGLPFVQPSVGDIDNDGNLEILAGGSIPNKPYARFFVWHHDGTIADGWPIEFPWDETQEIDYIYAQPVIGDIDGDTDVEIIVGSYKDKLYAWHHDATNVTGFPKIIGNSVDSTAAIGDIDNDNLVEIVVGGDDGKIYVWDLEGTYNSSNIQWPMFQYDQHHTGLYSKETDNHLPFPPSINGPTGGKPGIEYDYTFNSTDPDGDSIMYFIDWGDTTTEWTEFSSSGEEITLKHTWDKIGDYQIKAKAKDIHNYESDWAEFDVNIPRNRISVNLIFLRFLARFPIIEKMFSLIKIY